MTDNENTTVIFRKWRAEPKSVIALFPYEPGSVGKPETCQSFEHMGQHGAADLAGVMSATRPATAEEFAALKRELESKPYDYKLTVVQRTPPDAADVRRRALQRS